MTNQHTEKNTNKQMQYTERDKVTPEKDKRQLEI